MDIDEDNAADVLAPLRHQSPAPPRVSLDEAIGAGLRRRRVQRMTAAGGVAVAIAAIAVAVPFGINAVRHTGSPVVAPAASSKGAVAAPHSAAASAVPTTLSCTEQLLPIPDGVTKALVGAGDPAGRYLVGRSYPKGRAPQPLIWDKGVAHQVPIKGDDANLWAVSSNGTAVGGSFSGDVESAFIYRDGTVTKLGGMTNVEPLAVNNAGTVAGTHNVDHTAVPIVWRTPESAATSLSMPGPNWRGAPAGVTDNGTIVGDVKPAFNSTTSQGIIWRPDGSFQLLPLPKIAGVSGINGFWAFSVRQNVIIGQAIVNTKQRESFYPVAYDMNTGTYTDLHRPKLLVSSGNAQHRLVGMDAKQRPALWTPGTGLVNLPTQAGAKPDSGGIAAYISDDGTLIAGQDTDKKGVMRAVEWRCH